MSETVIKAHNGDREANLLSIAHVIDGYMEQLRIIAREVRAKDDALNNIVTDIGIEQAIGDVDADRVHRFTAIKDTALKALGGQS